MSEIKQIMNFLGRPQLDGEVRGSHLGKILMHLETVKSEPIDKTLSILALKCGMSYRYVRENYVKGLEYLGIIKLFQKNNVIWWKWFGLNGIDNKDLDLSEVKEPKKGLCLNPECNKKVPKDKKYCNQKCLSRHLEIKKEKK